MNVKLRHVAAGIGFAAALMMSGQSSAIPIQVNASGTVTESQLFDGVEVGDRWTVQLTFDSQTPDSSADPTRGWFRGLQSLDITVGDSYALSLDDFVADTTSLLVRVDTTPALTFRNLAFFYGEVAGTNLAFSMPSMAFFTDAADRILTSDAMPDPAALTSLFTASPYTDLLSFGVFDVRDGVPFEEFAYVNATVDSFTAADVSVPEPSALVLFAPALVMLGFASRRRRRV